MKKEHGLAMVEQAFDHAVKKGDIDPDTKTKYFGYFRSFYNTTLTEIKEESTDKKGRDAYNPKFWTGGWVNRHLNGLLDRFHGKTGKPVSGSYIEGFVHAVGKLQQIVKNDGVWKKQGIDKVRVGLKGSVEEGTGYLSKIYNEGANMSKDERTSMKATDDDYRKMLNGIDKVLSKDDRNYQTVKNIITSQRHTGGRITAECNLKVGDIDLDKMLKKYDKDKNNFTRHVPLEVHQKLFYAKLTLNKADGSPLFPLFDKDGKQMSKEAASKYMQETYKKIADKVGLYERDENGKITKRYTSHSTRRCYGQQIYNSTRYKKEKKVDELIKEYVNKQGSNKEGILERIKNEKDRLNWYRKKNGLPPREGFTYEEKRRLLVMLHLGHSRVDTCLRYINPDPPLRRNFRKS